MANGRPWTEYEEAWLEQVWPNKEISAEAIAHALKRTLISIHSKVNKLGITRKWSEKESLWLTDNYGRVPARVIAQEFHRTEEAIHHKARKLGLDGTGQLSHAGKNNPAWKGNDNVGYSRQHVLTRERFPVLPKMCEICGKNPVKERMRADATLLPLRDDYVILSCYSCNRLHNGGSLSITFTNPDNGKTYCAFQGELIEFR